MTLIRSPRGRWGVLSPAYKWSIKDRLKTYPSLLNYLADDSITDPLKLLSEHIPTNNDRVISGMKLLLFHNPQFKNYLHSCPQDVRYVNRYHPELEILYSSNLLSAKESISKYRVKGDEVIEKKKEFEMLGAKVIGDEAVFDYNAEEDVKKTIYNANTQTWLESLQSIGSMFETYIFLNQTTPPWMEKMEIVNPSVFYVAKKTHGEKIARMLSTIDPSEFEDVEDVMEILQKTMNMTGDHYMYYVIPKRLHYSIKSDNTLSEIKDVVDFHIEHKTSHEEDIVSRLKFFQYMTKTTKNEIMRQNIIDEFVNDKTSDEIVMRTDDEPEEIFMVDTHEVVDDTHHEEPVMEGVQIEEIVLPPPLIEEAESEEVPPQVFQNEPVNIVEDPVTPIHETPATQEAQPSETPQPVVAQEVQSVEQPQEQHVDFNEKFKPMDSTSQVGKMIEVDETISPFNTRMVTYDGVKYKGMISALYNLAISDLLGTSRVYTSAPSSLRKKLLQEVEEEEIDKWWKEKGWIHLRKMMNTEEYMKKLYSHRHIDKKPLIFIAAKRPVSNPVFEHYIGIIKLGNGDDKEGSFGYKGARYKGFNCASQFI